MEDNNRNETEGLIVKATGGFYYVDNGKSVIECRARGLFRKAGMSPLVGDRVKFLLLPNNKGSIEEIYPRKNAFVRPPLSNLDQLIMVVSVAEPEPNLLVIDKLIAVAEHQDVEPILVFTKTDLASSKAYADIYRKSGFTVIETSAHEHRGGDAVLKILEGKISAFSGNSGVGKSTLLNNIFPELGIATSEISKKLGRGRHTTRHVELFKVGEHGWVADTPGFSSIDLEKVELIRKDALSYCFREFEPYINKCKFTGCSHVSEKGCAVLKAVEEGEIPKSRHQNYCLLYEEAKSIKEWELK